MLDHGLWFQLACFFLSSFVFPSALNKTETPSPPISFTRSHQFWTYFPYRYFAFKQTNIFGLLCTIIAYPWYWNATDEGVITLKVLVFLPNKCQNPILGEKSKNVLEPLTLLHIMYLQLVSDITISFKRLQFCLLCHFPQFAWFPSDCEGTHKRLGEPSSNHLWYMDPTDGTPSKNRTQSE